MGKKKKRDYFTSVSAKARAMGTINNSIDLTMSASGVVKSGKKKGLFYIDYYEG